MNSIDPAWFYSSLAQAAAAIVGLVGAILGSRIIDHIVMMRLERKDLGQKIDGVRNVITERIAQFNTFKNYLIEEIANDSEAMRVGNSTRKISQEILWSSSRSGSPWTIEVAKHRIESEQNLDFLEKLIPEYGPLLGEVKESSTLSFASRLREHASLMPFDNQGRQIALADAAMLEDVIRQVSHFRLKLIPRTFVSSSYYWGG